MNNSSKYIIIFFIFLLSLTACGPDSEQPDTDPSVNIIEIPRSVSRTSGVAPLSVHFTAGFFSSSTTSRTFHDYEYSWDFGDPESNNWGTTNKSKNSSKGPISVHIYKKPGNYTTTLTIRDDSGLITTDTFEITVTDPDDVYSGSNTICVSTDSDFSGAPDGAMEVTTSDLSEVMQYVESGKRILFHRGSSWSVANLDFPNNSGPVTIGAYGDGNNPDTLGIYSNAPQITVTDGNFLSLSRKQNWRIMDIHLLEPTGNFDLIGGAYDMQRILFLHMRVDGGKVGLGWSHWNNSSTPLVIDQMVLTESIVSDAKNNGIYVGGERIGLLGNIVKNSKDSHVARVWQGYKGVISHNIFSGASIEETTGRHALKLHGPGASDKTADDIHNPPVEGTSNLENRTEFTVISDNIFGSSGPWPVAIGPHSVDSDAEVWDVIFERNRLISDYGVQNPILVSVSLNIWGRFISVRNNIFDGTESGNDYRAIVIHPSPYITTTGNRIFNNICFDRGHDGAEILQNYLS